MGKFINPFTDIGFKRIFGQEVSKPVLITFLNCLLEGEHHITDLQFLDKEQPGDSVDNKSLIYDVYCEVEGGGRIIVEMQNRSQPFFKERSIYYLSRSISRQGEPGPKWNYSDLKAVYLIALLNFKQSAISNELRTDVALMDMKHKTPFSDKLRMVFLQLPYFMKEAEECDTLFDKIIYVLKNMEVLKRMPWVAQEAVFQKLASIADVASLSKKDRLAYDENLRKYRDTVAVMEGQWLEGHAKGMAEGHAKGVAEGHAEGMAEGHAKGVAEGHAEGIDDNRRDNARRMKADNMPTELIAKYTGLSVETINGL